MDLSEDDHHYHHQPQQQQKNTYYDYLQWIHNAYVKRQMNWFKESGVSLSSLIYCVLSLSSVCWTTQQ